MAEQLPSIPENTCRVCTQVTSPACARSAMAGASSACGALPATACKALCRCVDCREPFDYFKPL